ncbi:glycosyltransferase family 1 protein [Sphingobium amiense]|uniref:Glycosyltransferase family 1 protein n=2 Tax=Sphingobium amiense TaxID=135719 RepID=A0A494WG84_9SPHN|nr:glycosyltransferase family 4 protein [Sphingobium amiense]BBD99729.1 glycosyltransferase family 1 protein [Sphingobium amiense]
MTLGPILCVCTRYSLGGAPMNAKMLAEQFRLRGYDAQAWYMMNVASETDHSDGVRILHDRPPAPILWPSMLSNFHRDVQRARPFAMIGFHPLANVASAIASRSAGARFVGTQRNPADSQTPLLAKAEKWLGSRDFYHANIAVSRSVAESYGDYPASYRAKMAVVHNALPPLPPITETKAEARIALGLPTEDFLLGSLGRLADQKNVEFLIDVLALLPAGMLAIAGEGPNEAAIREKISALGLDARVRMMGPLTGRDVPLFYTALDSFLMPSRFEGFGRTLVEAMSHGTRTIAHDLPVLREVSKGAAALLPIDAQCWADAIMEVQNAPESRMAAWAAESRAVAQSYTLDAMVESYLKILGLPARSA